VTDPRADEQRVVHDQYSITRGARGPRARARRRAR
jgi:hypothetical protein